MHHKKGRRQRNARAGCKMCKPHKSSGCKRSFKPLPAKALDKLHRQEMRGEI